MKRLNPKALNTTALNSTAMIYLALAGVLAIGAVAVAIDGGSLFATANLVDMLTRTSLTGFLAIGMTLVILCRSLDLSVGYTAALSSLIAATTMDGQTGTSRSQSGRSCSSPASSARRTARSSPSSR